MIIVADDLHIGTMKFVMALEESYSQDVEVFARRITQWDLQRHLNCPINFWYSESKIIHQLPTYRKGVYILMGDAMRFSKSFRRLVPDATIVGFTHNPPDENHVDVASLSGIIYQNEEFRKNSACAKELPSCVFYPMVPSILHSVHGRSYRLGGVAFTGGFDCNHSWRDARAVCSSLLQRGIVSHVYPGFGVPGEVLTEYDCIGCCVHSCYGYEEMLRRLATHDFVYCGGYAGSIGEIVKNKEFDAIAAGVEILSNDAPGLERMLEPYRGQDLHGFKRYRAPVTPFFAESQVPAFEQWMEGLA